MRTNIYYIILCLCALCVSSCGKEDVLENKIDFSSDYEIKDDPSDPIQHHKYLIYQKYGIPVFFNDTVSATVTGTNYDGKPIYRYETLDLNWSFSSHNNNKVSYEYEYIKDTDKQEKALEFVEAFLQRASKPMRPFSIFLPETLVIKSDKGTETPEYYSGFRTLIVPNVQDLTEEEIPEFSDNILRSMVRAKVLQAEAVVNSFSEVSSTNKYYNKPWVISGNNGGLGCQWGVAHKGSYWKPEILFDEDTMKKYIATYWSTNVNNEEEFIAERTLIFQQIGQYGFISGNTKDKISQTTSPSNASEDLEYYLDTMLEIGSATFLERYGASPLVLKKYNILADYIKGELGVEF